MEQGHQPAGGDVTWNGDQENSSGTPAETYGRRINLARSASLSEKELNEARDRSQIIAAQLTIPSNTNSRGVQLFNRRKERVNAFTLVSFGKGVQQKGGENVEADSCRKVLTWKEKCASTRDRELNRSSSEPEPTRSSPALKCKGSQNMEDLGGSFPEVANAETQEHERHFVPVNEKKLSEEPSFEVNEEVTLYTSSNRYIELNEGKSEMEMNGPAASEIPNGTHSLQRTINGTSPMAKPTTTIVNRTARPFGSPNILCSPEARSPLMVVSSAPSYPTFSKPPPPAFSSPPPPPSFSPSPVSPPSNLPLPHFSSPPPVSRIISPTSCSPQFTAAMAPRPQYIPQPASDGKQQVSIKTGILEEGIARRAGRKSMFTFQEKPKVAPNPELLSLVQGVDEKKKQRSHSDQVQEEELLELGAEASNFLAKKEAIPEVAKVPAWSSCLKSSEVKVTCEPKPEQGLVNVSGKGAELFARRQSRMEKYVLETPSVGARCVRSPSPTMSLPPSWVFPSNMPGRVKAMASSSKIILQLPRADKAAPVNLTKKEPVSESPVLENGCTKTEMELSKHKPYQLDSSLFILNPTKDPVSALPKGAPPPKSVLPEKSYMRQASLPLSPTPLSPHFNSPAPFRPSAVSSQSPVNGFGSVDIRADHRASPRAEVVSPASLSSPDRVASGIQAPRPTFCAKKAGIQPQVRRESLPACSSSWVPPQPRRLSSTEGTRSGAKSPSELQSAPLQSWNNRCQSPVINQDLKANRRLLAKNIINAAKRKNSPSPGTPSSSRMPISPSPAVPHAFRPFSPFQPRVGESPTFISPPPTPTRAVHSPVCLYTPRSLTDSDVESEDSGLRSPGTRSYNTCPRGWGSSLRMKASSISADL